MWFKNLRIYRLTDLLPCPVDELGERLLATSFVPCGGLDTQRSGWVSPMGPTATHLVHSAANFHLVCARTQQRLLPAAAIREVLDEKILEIEAAEGRELRKRERANLKDEVIQTLLPRALTRSHLTYAFLAESRGLLLIDSSSPARAEDLLNLLRDSLGRLPVKPLVPRHSPVDLMTRWLHGGRLPPGFRLGQQCDMRDPLQRRERGALPPAGARDPGGAAAPRRRQAGQCAGAELERAHRVRAGRGSGRERRSSTARSCRRTPGSRTRWKQRRVSTPTSR
jgi:recombination associated protein RdgC